MIPEEIFLKYKYLFMIIIVSIILILSLLVNYNLLFINYQYSIIMYWIISITAMNLKIIDDRFNGLLLIVPISFALPGTFLYFNLIDNNLILGLSYLVLISYAFILSQKTRVDVNYNIIAEKKILVSLLLVLFVSLGIIFNTETLNDLRTLGLSNIVFFAIAGPIIEGIVLLLVTIHEHRKFLFQRQLYDVVALANVLFVSVAVSLNVFLMLLSIAGNSLKMLLGFRIGVLLDYFMRVVVLALVLVGVGIYA